MTPLYVDAAYTTYKEPRSIITDCMCTILQLVRAVGDNFMLCIRNAGINKMHANNNIYERFNGTYKDIARQALEFKVLRSAPLRLFMAYYNLFRSHEGLGDISPTEYPWLRIRT